MKEHALAIINRLRDHGHIAVFAGGVVRDMLLNRPNKDFDIATCARPEKVLQLFPHSVDDGLDQGVIKVIVDSGITIDVATLRKDGSYSDGRRPDSVEFTDNLEEDSRRRDFTINALFFCPIENKIFDFHDGQRDIQDTMIKAVGNAADRFMEDKLRMMRAIRFSVQLPGFYLQAAVRDAIKAQAADILSISKERITEEFYKILSADYASLGVMRLNDSGLLQHILPEVTGLIGCAQDPIHHPEGDVWTHSLGVLNWLTGINDPFLGKADADLRFAGLLHDIGKPCCAGVKLDKEGRTRITHVGHELSGADLFAGSVAPRFSLSNPQKYKIKELIRLHMKMHQGKEMKRSTLLDLFRHRHIKDLVKLQWADGMNSGHADKVLKDFYCDKLQELHEATLAPCVIDGNDLIGAGYKPGPFFEDMLKWVRIRQDDLTIHTREEALKKLSYAFPLERVNACT